MRRWVRLIAIAGRQLSFGQIFVRREFRVGHLNRNMRDDEWQIQKERPVLMISQELNRLGGETLLRMNRPGRARVVADEHFLLAVLPQKLGVVVMGMSLASVAVEEIEALFVRVARRAEISQPPLTDCAGRVAAGFEQFGNRHQLVGNRTLPSELLPPEFRAKFLGVFIFAIVANVRMSGMAARHQHAAGRRTNGRSAIKLREPHAVACEGVEVRRFNFRLPVAAEFGIAQVVGHDQDDVRRTGGFGRLSCRQVGDDEQRGGQGGKQSSGVQHGGS